jgi:hypothetical protein
MLVQAAGGFCHEDMLPSMGKMRGGGDVSRVLYTPHAREGYQILPINSFKSVDMICGHISPDHDFRK